MKQVKWFTPLILPALLLTMLLQACENDLNQVREVSTREVHNPVDTTKGVDMIYSDSAKVKAHVLTPLVLKHKPPGGLEYNEMTQGVKIIFYDTKLNSKQLKDNPDKHIVCIITADYAIQTGDGATSIFTMKRHVVVTNNLGDTFKSEELIWDSLKKEVYTNKPCQIDKVDGTSGSGTSFHSNETFTDYTFKDGRGDIVLRGNSGF